MDERGSRLVALLGALALAFCGAAYGQSGAPLTGKEIAALVTGKTIVYRSNLRTDGAFWESTMFMRSDGSFRFRCTNYSRAGDRTPCPRVPGGDAGTWEVRGDTMCIRQLVREGHMQCFAWLRDGPRYRFRQVSGPAATGDGAYFEVRD